MYISIFYLGLSNRWIYHYLKTLSRPKYFTMLHKSFSEKNSRIHKFCNRYISQLRRHEINRKRVRISIGGACPRKRISIHDRYTWHAHYVILSTHALLGLQNVFAVPLCDSIRSFVWCACFLPQGDVRLWMRDTRIHVRIKGGKFWNVEQRKNMRSTRRTRGKRGLHEASGTTIFLL